MYEPLESSAGIDAIVRWKLDPIAWVREDLGVEPDEWQLDVLNAYADFDVTRFRIAMMACAGPGKSAVMSWVLLHFATFEGDPDAHVFPQGACVSITADNLRDGLWKELGVWLDQSVVASRLLTKNNDRIFVEEYKDKWFLSARTFSKSADERTIGATLSGLHSRKQIYGIDEVGDMPVQIGTAAEQGMKQSDALRVGIVAAGNPMSREGLLYELAIRQAHRYYVVSITGDPDDPKRSPRIDIEEAREEIRQRGRGDPWVMAYILGQFPPGEFNALLTEDQVLAAMRRKPKPGTYEHMACTLGVDVADEGPDRSIIFPRQGIRGYHPVVMHNASGMEGAGRMAALYRELPVDASFIDGGGGYGNSWIEQCSALGILTRKVYFGGQADDPKAYANRVSQNWYRMAEWIKDGGCLPDIPEMVRELTARTYAYPNGRFTLEKKDSLREKLNGLSPDYSDAFSTNFDVILPPKQFAHLGHTEFARTVDDPLEGY